MCTDIGAEESPNGQDHAFCQHKQITISYFAPQVALRERSRVPKVASECRNSCFYSETVGKQAWVVNYSIQLKQR